MSRLATEIARFAGGGIKVSSVNGRILLSGTVADAVTLDKTVSIARQFVPDVINTVQVMRPQQIMLEVRFIEVSRSASRQLGVQWNMFGSGAVANIGNQVPAQQLPITAAGGSFQQPAAANSRYRRGERIPAGIPARRCRQRSLPAFCRAPRRSVSWSVNCSAEKTHSTCRSTRSNKKVSPAAWRNPIWWPCPEIPRASLPAGSFRSRRPAALARSHSLTSPTASDSRSRRPCSVAG